jgi:hypothetical protein
MARLVSNIPVLKSGHPPIVIPSERRRDYINILVKYQLEAGIPNADKKIVLHGKSLDAFKAFCLESWGKSLDLVDQARQRQAARD